MDRQRDQNTGKFAEPRSWSARWCGYGLMAREPRRARVDQVGRAFAQPRGWSVKWCGGGLGTDRNDRT